MRLSKAKLIKEVKPGLEKLGFKEFKDSKNGMQGLFCKKLEEGLYLTLGLTIHRFYESFFTSDYYLSKTTIIGATWGDIPNDSYKRPSFLLTKEERSIYYDDGVNVKGAYDIWWNGNDKKSIINFLTVIELTESRFINQDELIKQIQSSKDLIMLFQYAEKVRELIAKNAFHNFYKFLPKKELDDIPMVWFKASEDVLTEAKEVINAYTVVRLAADAYRQNELSKI